MGISAQAMPATHWEAELGLYVSVPSVCKTCGTDRQAMMLRCQRPETGVAWAPQPSLGVNPRHAPSPAKLFARSAFSPL